MLEILGCFLALVQGDGEGGSEISIGQLFNLLGHGCGKHKGLVLVYEAGDDEFDV